MANFPSGITAVGIFLVFTHPYLNYGPNGVRNYLIRIMPRLHTRVSNGHSILIISVL